MSITTSAAKRPTERARKPKREDAAVTERGGHAFTNRFAQSGSRGVFAALHLDHGGKEAEIDRGIHDLVGEMKEVVLAAWA